MEKMPEFSNLIKVIKQEEQKIPSKINTKKTMPRYIIIKWLEINDKEIMLKTLIEK